MWLCLNGTCNTLNADTTATCTTCGIAGFQLRLFDPGTMIGSYEIRRFVGHGGYGVVYEAMKREDNKVLDIALKQTSLRDYRALERELSLLHRLNHPNLPTYYEAFQWNGAGYLAMEFVQGLNLKELLSHAGNPLGERQVLQYALELCAAVGYLHAQTPPLLHRDIKPANIRLTPEGRIKLVDFGLTKVDSEATRTTQQGATLGYAPIEQITGIAKTDQRSDIYSIGATLYHLLTNEIPISSLERGLQGTDPLKAPERLNPKVRPDLFKIVRKAMERKQEARYPTTAALHSALQVLLGPAVVDQPAKTTGVPLRSIGIGVLLGVAVLLLLVAWGASNFATGDTPNATQIAGVSVLNSTETAAPTIAATATFVRTAIAEATQVVEVAIPSATLPPSATDTPEVSTPTPEPTATEAPDIVSGRGELLYRESFDSNGWNWYETEDGSRQVVEGVYRIDQTKSRDEWEENPDSYISPDAPDFERSPRLDGSYEVVVDVTIPPNVPHYSIGFDANLQQVTLDGTVEYASHTFTIRSDNLWEYAGGSVSVNDYFTGPLLTPIELRDGTTHELGLQLFPEGEGIRLVFLVDQVVVATTNSGAAPATELIPVFQSGSGTVGLVFGSAPDFLEQITTNDEIRLVAEFDNLEIYSFLPENQSSPY